MAAVILILTSPIIGQSCSQSADNFVNFSRFLLISTIGKESKDWKWAKKTANVFTVTKIGF